MVVGKKTKGEARQGSQTERVPFYRGVTKPRGGKQRKQRKPKYGDVASK